MRDVIGTFIKSGVITIRIICNTYHYSTRLLLMCFEQFKNQETWFDNVVVVLIFEIITLLLYVPFKKLSLKSIKY
ncbi:hypothetical protein RCL_jg6099.t1 [Rhizophagus clarus]|uniref:Uncharacterized protein n=1 Tax=Rhizophagus clarus TaxID=94130 RepID=A0A8H3L476_9GLOM|nr:hypothetical protein RCL_jg6099.t1 [Rhizophagus clarus]